jgi:hypothetical protein
MSPEFEVHGVASDAELDGLDHLWAETVVTVAGTMFAAILVSSIGVLMYLA